MENMTTWYATLAKPAWAPPTKAFGIAWGIIYPIIFVTFGLVFLYAYQGKIPKAVALPFMLNLALNLSFTSVQFGLKNQSLSLLWMILIVATLIWAMVAVFPHFKWIAVAQLPYLLWGAFALGLQLALWWLN